MEKIQGINALKASLISQLEPKFSLSGVTAWIATNQALLNSLLDTEREELTDYFCAALSRHLKEISAAFRRAMQPLHGKLDQAFHEELSPDALLQLQKEIYSTCAHLLPEMPQQFSDRGFYDLQNYIQEAAILLGGIFCSFENFEANEALGHFLHDMGSLEGYAIRDMEYVHDYSKLNADQGIKK
jgi:hypothetical protein